MSEEMEYLLEVPKDGEYELKQYLRANGVKVRDVSNDGYYQSKDIDLLCTPPSTSVGPYSVEVKWDKRISETQNLFWEFKNREKDGWGKYCEADFLFYGDAFGLIFYIFPTEKLRKYVEANTHKFKVQRAFDFYKDGCVRGESLGYLVPLSEVSHLCSTLSL